MGELFAGFQGWGVIWAALGAAVATFLACTGSAIGVGRAGQAATGVLAEEPEKFGSCLILELLPGSQGIYGMVISFLIMNFSGIMSGNAAALSGAQGFGYFIAALPCAIGCLTSAIHQGKVAASSIALLGKRGDSFGNGMTLTLGVELYALFSFLISYLLVANVM